MKRTIVLTVILLLTASRATLAQPVFPPRGIAIIDALAARHPDLARGSDDDRRALTKAIVEQLVCEFPGDGYVWKSADPTRPPSKDAIARQVAGRLYVWDWQNGTTRERAVQAGQRAEDITSQHPIPLGCVNHLGSAPGPPPVDPDLPPASVDLAPLARALERLEREVVATREDVDGLEQKVETVRLDVAGVRTSLEEHRQEARKTRTRGERALRDWRTWVAVGAALGGYVLRGGGDEGAK